jgi:hypothetical protein
MDSLGCRVVQRAIEVADRAMAIELIRELRGHVQDLIQSPHGNYVVQKVAEVLPPILVSFVVRELHGSAAEFARHRFGCRVLIRLIEHGTYQEEDFGKAELIEELFAELDDLCRHPFAHHVVKAIVEHAPAELKNRVLVFLCTRASRKVQDRYCGYVMEAALEGGPEQQVRALAEQLLGDTQAGLIQLSQSRHGCNILRLILKLPGPISERALGMLRTAAPRLREMGGTQRLLRDARLLA